MQRPLPGATLSGRLRYYPVMRHGRYIAYSALALCAAAPTTVNAQAESFLGPSVGVFFPMDGDLRDALGGSWFSFGASRVKIDPYQKRNIGVDWNAFSKEKSGNKVFMIAGTIGVNMPFGKPGDTTRPYFAVRGGLSYIDYAVNTAPLTRVGGKKLGFNGNVEVGVNVGHNFNVSGRYDLFPSYDGLHFSGFSVAVKWGVARF